MSFKVTGSSIADELERRNGQTMRLVRYLLAHPGEWIHAHTLAPICLGRVTETTGNVAVHSRIVEARELVAIEGWTIPHNGHNGSASAYMLRPAPLARSAETVVSGQGDLFRR